MIPMTKMTVSFAKAKASEVSISHNKRKDYRQNFNYNKRGHLHIHQKYTRLNVNLCDRKLVDVYDEKFGQEVARFNATKKRRDREIGQGCAVSRKDLKLARKNKMKGRGLLKSYGQALLDKVQQSKHGRAVQEFVIQIGNARDFNKTNSKGQLIDQDGQVITGSSERDLQELVSLDRQNPHGKWQQAKQALIDYYYGFKKRNPHLIPVSAQIHMDEASPHLHLDVVPVGVNQQAKRGLKIKPAFNRALDNEGYHLAPHDNRGQWRDFQSAEQQALEPLMQKELGVTRKQGLTNHLANTKEYQKAQSAIVKSQLQAAKQKQAANDLTKRSKFVQHQLDQQHQELQNNQDKLNAEQDKLDEVASYPRLRASFNADKNKAKQEQKDAEAARDKALQQKEAAIEVKKQQLAQNAAIKAALVARESNVDQREKKLKEKEKKLKTRKKVLDLREFGGNIKDPKTGKVTQYIGLRERERKLREREKRQTARENSWLTKIRQFKNNFMRDVYGKYYDYGIKHRHLSSNAAYRNIVITNGGVWTKKSGQKTTRNSQGLTGRQWVLRRIYKNNLPLQFRGMLFAVKSALHDKFVFKDIEDKINQDQQAIKQEHQRQARLDQQTSALGAKTIDIWKNDPTLAMNNLKAGLNADGTPRNNNVPFPNAPKKSDNEPDPTDNL